MRIAQIAPLTERCPPRLYGGTERIVSYLTEELVRQGHDVTLFASGDSQTSARLESGAHQALRFDPGVKDGAPHHILMLDQVLRQADQFDVMHFHTDIYHFPLIRHLAQCDHASRASGYQRLPMLLPSLSRSAAGFDFQGAAQSGEGRRQLGGQCLPWHSARFTSLQP